MKRITLELTSEQLWQLDYMVGAEIKRIEKLIISRMTQGKLDNKTFANALAFDIRLKGVLAKAKS